MNTKIDTVTEVVSANPRMAFNEHIMEFINHVAGRSNLCMACHVWEYKMRENAKRQWIVIVVVISFITKEITIAITIHSSAISIISLCLHCPLCTDPGHDFVRWSHWNFNILKEEGMFYTFIMACMRVFMDSLQTNWKNRKWTTWRKWRKRLYLVWVELRCAVLLP